MKNLIQIVRIAQKSNVLDLPALKDYDDHDDHSDRNDGDDEEDDGPFSESSTQKTKTAIGTKQTSAQSTKNERVTNHKGRPKRTALQSLDLNYSLLTVENMARHDRAW